MRKINSKKLSKWPVAYITPNHFYESAILSYLSAKDFIPFKLGCEATEELILALGNVVVNE
ncbi:MAG: hypothetical protein COB61_001520 [Thiotrichales bacterium]|nr:hypothetical protein [Thiotrichales bacterium]